jgi:hypothetical protein
VLGRWRDTKAEGSEEAACQPATRDTTGKRGLVCVSWIAYSVVHGGVVVVVVCLGCLGLVGKVVRTRLEVGEQ